MKTKIITLIISSFFMLLSCSNNDDENNFTAQNITPELIGKGTLDGNGSENISQQNIVISTQTQFDNLISDMNTVNNVSDSFTQTTVDFNSFMLIAVFLEVKPAGWAVEITNIVEQQDEIIVSYSDTESDATVISQPFHIVKIPITSKPIVFQ